MAEGRIASIPRCTRDGPVGGKPHVGDVVFSSFTCKIEMNMEGCMNLGGSRGVKMAEGRITPVPRCARDGPDIGKT